MENLNLGLLSSSSSGASPRIPSLGSRNPNPRHRQLSPWRPFSFPLRNHRPAALSSALPRSSPASRLVIRNSSFANVSNSSSAKQTASVGVTPQPVPPPPSQVGSPLFWIGVGVGLSALFSWVASYLKKYAMQQAFKTMMNQMNTQNNQFSNSPFSAGSPFPFPPPTAPGSATPPFSTSIPKTSPTNRNSAADTATSASSVASQTPVTVDVPATQVEAAPVPDPVTGWKEESDRKEEPKKYSFVDVSPGDALPQSPFSGVEDDTETSSSKDTESLKETVSQNGAIQSQSSTPFDSNQSTRKTGSGLSVDALEKMLEDPTVQKMVYPYLPEEMRNPATFKWMLQNPQYRQQLEEMLNGMSGKGEWDDRMLDTLKNFDLSSPEVKQQFDQIGLTPEEVISKIMSNPDVAMAFQNPRVQQAILDCSQNPMNITKYQNDKEVMDVFNKISELFPGVGSP